MGRSGLFKLGGMWLRQTAETWAMVISNTAVGLIQVVSRVGRQLAVIINSCPQWH